MPTANEELFNRTVRHAVFLERFKGGETRELVKAYVALEADIKAQLARIDPMAVSGRYRRARLQKLLADVKEIIHAFSLKQREDFKEAQQGVLDIENRFGKTAVKSAVPLDWEWVLPAAAQVHAAINARPFEGRFLSEWFQGLERLTQERVSAAITQGVIEGQTTREIIGRLRRATLQSARGAEMVTRTALNHVSSVAREEFYDANSDIVKGVRWVSTLDARTSLICATRDGKVYPVGEGPRPPAHPNCLPADTLVLSRDGVAGVCKRWYEGEIVIVHTAGGKKLSCTPNHPVLTGAGWVAAGKLDVGGNVVCDGGIEWGASGINVQHEHVPARIEDVAEAFFKSAEVVAVPVPTTSEDFHGDGMDGDVAIVTSNRFLRDRRDPAVFKEEHEAPLVVGDVALRSFAGFGPLKQLGLTSADAFDGCMGVAGEAGALGGVGASHSRSLLLGTVAEVNAVLFKNAGDHVGRDAKALCNPSNPNSGGVEGFGVGDVDMDNLPVFQCAAILAQYPVDDAEGYVEIAGNCGARPTGTPEIEHGRCGETAAVSASLYASLFEDGGDGRVADVEGCRDLVGAIAAPVAGNSRRRDALSVLSHLPDAAADHDAVGFQHPVDGGSGDACLARDILDGASGSVFLDDITLVERHNFCGHVFNLETEKGFYSAGGVITHNCRSTTVSVLKSWRELGIDRDEAPEGMRASMNGQVPAGLYYGEWLKQQPIAVQEEALGKAKAKLFREGGLSLDRFVLEGGQELDLAALRERYPKSFERAGFRGVAPEIPEAPEARERFFRAVNERIESKTKHYLLDEQNEKGKAKAHWLIDSLGFSADNPDEFTRQVIYDPKEAKYSRLTRWGERFTQVIPLQGPNGRTMPAKFVWQIEDGVPRLITMTPAKKKDLR